MIKDKMADRNRQMDISLLFAPPRLDDREMVVLDEIDELKKQLAFGFSPKRWFGLLRRNAFANAVRASNSIEGYEISSDDAVAAIEGEEPMDAKTESWHANVCYRRAMTMVLQKADSPHFQYSTEMLDSLHFMMLDYDLTKNPGNWRKRPIFVTENESQRVVYEGPDHELVPALMKRLMESLNEDDETPSTIKAGMAHLNLVMIHAYNDGNGRLGRCLQTLVLARSGTVHPVFASIEEYLGRNTDQYYSVLAQVGAGSWQPHRDTRPWVRFILTAHFRQARTLLGRSTFYGQLFEVLEELVDRRGLPERAVAALADGVLGARVRNGTYRKLADIEMRTAGRDLRALTEAGLLLPQGRKRGRYYVASPDLIELTSSIERPRQVDDPFEALEASPVLPGFDGLMAK